VLENTRWRLAGGEVCSSLNHVYILHISPPPVNKTVKKGGDMPIVNVPLELIDDNPYNPRTYFPPEKIAGLATSIKENGLRQKPEARAVDGRYQLAYGHMRKRAFLKLRKESKNKGWGTMPLDVEEISDKEMSHYALIENLGRTDLRPLEMARSIENFFITFPDEKETELAKTLDMTQANISNMRRVLKLPKEILDKINEGRINFTMARELLVLSELSGGTHNEWDRKQNKYVDKQVDDVELMRAAISQLRAEGSSAYNTFPCTVEGMVKSIDLVAKNHFMPLKKGQCYYHEPYFDTQECLKCDKCLTTHPDKKLSNHWCTNKFCWEDKQKQHKDAQATVAQEKIKQEIMKQVAAELPPEPEPSPISQEISTSEPKKIEPTVVPIPCDFCKQNYDKTCDRAYFHTDDNGKLVCERRVLCPRRVTVDKETFDNIEPSYSAHTIAQKNSRIVTTFDFEGSPYVCIDLGATDRSCYRVVEYFAVEGDYRTTYKKKEGIKTQAPEGFYHHMVVKFKKEERVLIGPPVIFILQKESKTAEFIHTVHTNDTDTVKKLVSERGAEERASEAAKDAQGKEPEKQGILQQLLDANKDKVGTRADILDLKDIGLVGYIDQTSTHALLSNSVLDQITEPAFCLTKCVEGFHYAYDSRQDKPEVLHVCSNPKCLTSKKAAFTRAKNVEGLTRKKIENKAIKQAIEQTIDIDKPRLKLVLLALLSLDRTYYGGDEKSVNGWLWDKISAGTPQNERTQEALFKRIDKLLSVVVAQLIVELIFYKMVYRGDTGKYQIKTKEPLSWMGIEIEEEEAKEGGSN
jgi:ParB/RepB/Spo0J family partition protein